MTESLQIAFGVLGLIGLSGIAAALRSSTRLTRRHRFLRLRQNEPLDIVLPTSQRMEGGAGIKYMRSMTSIGNLRGAAAISQVAGGLGRRRPVSIAVSEELESALDGDLVVLGLPRKNAVSALVVPHLLRRHPHCGLTIQESDDDGCSIALGNFSEDFALELQSSSEIPSRDLALIVLWLNPLTRPRRRLILCAGFTTYGTAAAADYLLSGDLIKRYRERRNADRASLPSLMARAKWPCFAMVIEVRLINDQVVYTEELSFAPLPEPA